MAAIRASMRRFQVARQERDENEAALRALVAAARLSLSSDEVEREVEEKDFAAVVQLDLPRTARRMEVSEFAPLAFQKLRRFAHVPAAELLSSLCEASSPGRDLTSQGRSGAQFYRTQDGKFLIKCLTKADVKALRRMLSDLYAHITKSPSASLLSPPLALFKVDHPLPKSLAFPSKFFLITRHIAPEARLILDLKGCLLHRRASASPLRNPQAVYHVLKDRDILESRAQLVLASALRSPLLSQLHNDLEFLKDRGIIDYSLLLALTETGKKRRKTEKKEEKVFAQEEWEVIEEEPEVKMRNEGKETMDRGEDKSEEKSKEDAEEEKAEDVKEEKRTREDVKEEERTREDVKEEERTEEEEKEEERTEEEEKEEERTEEDVKEEEKTQEEDEEEEERTEEPETPTCDSDSAASASGIPVRLRINSFVNSTLSKPHAVLQDLSDVNPGSLRLQVNIIDYLTHYGLYHRMSGFLKHIRYGASVSTSTEPPSQYRFRLQAFTEHVVTSV